MSLNDKAVGILHPGAMGAAVGRQAVAGGATVLWLPAGRGADTRERAESAGLEAADDMATLAEECSVIISVCPSAFAGEVAGMVARSTFRGVFVEANAISPDRSLQISALLAEQRVTVVDGGIVGPPPRWPGGATRL
jgi:3-hydroxyisobutyrate dehydrogenase-like beta-hydroxyacid dehydrogenase